MTPTTHADAYAACRIGMAAWATAVHDLSRRQEASVKTTRLLFTLAAQIQALSLLAVRKRSRWVVMTEPVSVALRNHWFPWWGTVRNNLTGSTVFTCGALLLAVSVVVVPDRRSAKLIVSG